MDSIPQKRCSKCGIEYPATLEFFDKHRTCKYGVTAWCKRCTSDYHREYNKTPERRAKTAATGKRWHENNKDKLHDKYELNKLNPDWVEAKRVRSHRYNLSDRCKEKDRQRDKTPKRRTYRNKKSSDWRKTPKGRLHTRAMNARRRIRIKQSTEQHTTEDIQKQLISQKCLCWWCGCKLTDEYHVDHRIALAKGGNNGAGNICISCPKCNRHKHSKMPWEFNGRLL